MRIRTDPLIFDPPDPDQIGSVNFWLMIRPKIEMKKKNRKPARRQGVGSPPPPTPGEKNPKRCIFKAFFPFIISFFSFFLSPFTFLNKLMFHLFRGQLFTILCRTELRYRCAEKELKHIPGYIYMQITIVVV